MQNELKTRLLFGFGGIVLLYVAFLLVGILGWVTPASIIRIFSSEHLRGQVLAVLQTLSQPIAIFLSIGFLLVACNVIKKNVPVSISLWTALSVASLFIIGKMIIPVISLILFAWLLGPVLVLSLLLLILGIFVNILK